jgi:hypothetical protein
MFAMAGIPLQGLPGIDWFGNVDSPVARSDWSNCGWDIAA